MWHKYIVSMNAKSTPQSVLHQIAQIQRLERGTVSVIRQGPDGAYYNHQCYEEGRNVSRYVPLEQVAEVKEGIDGYRRFQELVQQYVQLMVEKTRAQREAGLKKAPTPEILAGHITENVVNLFQELAEVLGRNASGGTPDYWGRAMRQLVRNAADLAAIARVPTQPGSYLRR